jgi:hypothetical protein
LAELVPGEGAAVDHDIERVGVGECFTPHETPGDLIVSEEVAGAVRVRFEVRVGDLVFGAFADVVDQITDAMVVGAEDREPVPVTVRSFGEFNFDPGGGRSA